MGRMKKCTALLLSVLMLFTLAGCGKDGGQEAEGKGQQESSRNQAEDEYVYIPEYRTLGKDGYYMGNAIFAGEDRLYYTGVTNDGVYHLFSMELEDGGVQEIPLSLEAGTAVGGLCKGPEDNLLFLLLRMSQDTEAAFPYEQIAFSVVSPEGNIVETVDVTNVLRNNPNFYVMNMAVDGEGNYYIDADKLVYVFNPQGDLLFEVPVGQYINSMFPLKTGEVAVAYRADTGFKVETIDMAGGLQPLESKITFQYGTYQEGEQGDLLYTQDSALYQYHLKEEAPVKILSWVDCNLESTYIKHIKQISDEKLAVISDNWNSPDGMELTILTRKKRSEVKEKTVITYGTFYTPYFTDSDIIAFNKQSQDYRIEIKQYGDENTNYEDRITLLNADITNGQAPDLLDLNYIPYSLDDLISKGVLEDLAPYLEQDGELKREDFVESVFSAFERNGKVYGVMPGFGIQTLVGRAADFGDKEAWTTEEMISYADAQGEDTVLLANHTKDNILQTLCLLNADTFIDMETGSCHFAGEDFIRILEFANRFPDEITEYVEFAREVDDIRSGRAGLMEAQIGSVAMYQLYEYLFGEPVLFIGYPVSGTRGGNIISPQGTTVGMNTASSNKEGAWEFIRFNLTEERQENIVYASSVFPSRKEALEKQFAEDIQPDYYEDADGSQKERPKFTTGMGDFTVDVYAASQEQVDKVKSMIDHAVVSNTDSQIMAIIYEEAEAYFSGQKSAEDTAGLIQNRVQTYINESR